MADNRRRKSWRRVTVEGLAMTGVALLLGLAVHAAKALGLN